MPEFHHVFITRFNLAAPGRDARHRASKNWLEHRVDLFQRFCLPSVLAQSVGDIHWLLYCDLDTPPAIKSQLQAMTAGDARIQWLFGRLSDFPLHAIQRRVADLAPASARWQLTTQLDNDDSLPRDYVACVQEQARIGRTEVLNFPDGYVLAHDKLYNFRHLRNPFCTVSEDLRSNQTVMSAAHMVIDRIAPIRQVCEGKRMWIQNVHGRNVSNRIRGVRVRYTDDGRFPVLRSQTVQNPSRSAMVVERALLHPMRLGREAGIRLAKQAIGGLKRSD